MLLELQHLKKTFGTHKAVDDISFSLQEGNIFGLLGPNGAGKTTLIRMITGIFYPDAGNILFRGKPFEPLRDISQIGYMPEERGLYKKMKTGEQALYLAQLRGFTKREAEPMVREWFARLGMESWWGKKVEDLSKGMSQKLQFVTTVLHRPKLIILDEPFSGLDPVNAAVIKDEIFRLAKEGATIIFSTHRMGEVEEICNQIVLIDRGQKVLDGTVSGIKQQYKKNLFRIEFDAPPADAPHNAFEIVKETEKGRTVKLRDGGSPNAVLQHYLAAGNGIRRFEEILPSLNDIFIQIVESGPAARSFVPA